MKCIDKNSKFNCKITLFLLVLLTTLLTQMQHIFIGYCKYCGGEGYYVGSNTVNWLVSQANANSCKHEPVERSELSNESSGCFPTVKEATYRESLTNRKRNSEKCIERLKKDLQKMQEEAQINEHAIETTFEALTAKLRQRKEELLEEARAKQKEREAELIKLKEELIKYGKSCEKAVHDLWHIIKKF
ncbi:hypothetical protein RFI_06048 [Reticulomyxa filosa]|uniref:Uncharacterized protein n=1 Tax=Reticulomyxa filosa TaxID=46433 RepID=X6P0L4_RETFI|nr:hypothetical protein RFI_06048 [Reticulomyxa filosa]|eukprot:ETO31072.1 hypothetical protein RFI_06048 [Reticulomyxa filosa]